MITAMMAGGNEAKRSDRMERPNMRSLRFASFPPAMILFQLFHDRSNETKIKTEF
jgi:hypothetical protein